MRGSLARVEVTARSSSIQTFSPGCNEEPEIGRTELRTPAFDRAATTAHPEGMNEREKREDPDGQVSGRRPSAGLPDDALEDDALERVTGGSGGVAHELAHTVQQRGSGVGANETITIGANQSI